MTGRPGAQCAAEVATATLSRVPPTVRTLTATTRAIADPGALQAYLPAGDTWTAWLRRGEGVVGLGEALRFETDSIHEADAWWAEVCRTLTHTSDVAPGYGVGPLAFGSFAFDPETSAARSVLVVPRVVVGRRAGAGWITAVDGEPDLPPPGEPFGATPDVTWRTGALAPEAWEAAVAAAVTRIRAGELGRSFAWRGRHRRPAHRRAVVLARLAGSYPSTWAFHVDSRWRHARAAVRQERSWPPRVLAGTIRRHGEQSDEVALAQALAESSKDLAEHEYAVASVADALAPFCSGMNVPDQPYVLKLPNVMHLASDVTGVCDRGDDAAGRGASALALAAASTVGRGVRHAHGVGAWG
jgi:menaquinone-specific isochorismate synthase